MSFSCPHFDINTNLCTRLKCECIPGRPGCVIPKTTKFAVPASERIEASQHPQAKPQRRAGSSKPRGKR